MMIKLGFGVNLSSIDSFFPEIQGDVLGVLLRYEEIPSFKIEFQK
jgi:hypothetical protein